jgi:hypothetical protein
MSIRKVILLDAQETLVRKWFLKKSGKMSDVTHPFSDVVNFLSKVWTNIISPINLLKYGM